MGTPEYIQYPPLNGGGGGGVSSINTLVGDITLLAGAGISITPGGSTLTIAANDPGDGSVTSVALADSTGLFNITGSPVTTSGTLTLSSLQSQLANRFFAAPNGSNGAPTFRAIVSADIPTLNQNTTGTASNITASSNSTLTTLSSLSLPGAQVTGNISGNAANITASSNSTLTTLTALSLPTSQLTGTINLSTQASGILQAAQEPAHTGDVTNTAGSLSLSLVATSNSTLTTLSSLVLPGSQVTGNISGNAANVTGVVAIPNGGTGQTTQQAAINALAGTQSAGKYLRSDGSNTTLSSIQAGDVPTLNQNTTGTASNITASSNSTLTTLSALSLPFSQITGAPAAITALTGDGTATGPGSVPFTLATVNGNVGSFGSSTSIPSFTVNAKGLITAASGNAIIAPAGTLSGTTLNSTVVSSSLTSVGTITSGVWHGTTIGIPFGGTGVTSVTTVPTATSFAGWDVNSNLSANNFIGTAVIVTATGTQTLTVASPSIIDYTGTGATTVVLPDVTTLQNGTTFTIINSLNNNTLIVQTSGGNQLTSGFGNNVPTFITIATVINNAGGSGTGSWTWSYLIANGTTAPITGVGGLMNANVTLPSAGAFNIGNSSQPLGTLTCNTLQIYDNFGDTEGLITSTSFPNLRVEATFPAGKMAIATANNGAGNSGDISLTTGTATATRGMVTVDALAFRLPSAAANPTGTFTGGEVYYNTTTNLVMFYNGTIWTAL